MPIESIENVCHVQTIAGKDADPSAPPDVLIELPHGAVDAHNIEHYKRFAADYPERHDDLFWVNTDQGSPEYAQRFAELLTTPPSESGMPMFSATHGHADQNAARRKVLIVKAEIPRTIVDVNRLWEVPSEDFKKASLTVAVPGFVREEEKATIKEAYDAYQQVARQAYQLVCGEASGKAYNLHTYAPISVSPVEGEYIVDTLRRAYTPEDYPNHPKRPTVELITTPPEGECLADRRLVDALMTTVREAELEVHENDPFNLHPTTTVHNHAARYPGQVLCLEVSRAFLAEPFSPFEKMTIDSAKVEIVAQALARTHFMVYG